MAASLVAVAGPVHAKPTHKPRHRVVVAQAIAAKPPPGPEQLAALGRYVAIAPRCNVRDTLWAQRLDMALNDAITQAGADAMSAQRDLASAELEAVDELKKDSSGTCRALNNPPAATELRQADALVK